MKLARKQHSIEEMETNRIAFLNQKPTTINVYKGIETGRLYPDDGSLRLRDGRLFSIRTGEEAILSQKHTGSALISP